MPQLSRRTSPRHRSGYANLKFSWLFSVKIRAAEIASEHRAQPQRIQILGEHQRQRLDREIVVVALRQS